MYVKVLISLLMMLVSVQVTAQEIVRVHNWVDYIDPAVIRDFERDTGIKVEYSQYTTAAELDSDLDAGKSFDVIVPTDFQLDRLIKENRLAELDVTQLPSRSQVSRELLTRLASKDGADRYVIPYLWGTVGLVVHERAAAQALQAPIANSWSVLFDPANTDKLKSCGVALQNERVQTLSLYLNYKGKSLKNTGARGIEKAVREISGLGVSLSPSTFSSFASQLAEGRICAAMAWEGLASMANGKGELRYTIPEEGGLMFIDSLAIPRNARNVTSAYRFIDYILKPENAARNAKVTHFTPSLDLDQASNRRLLPEVTVPSQEERRRLYFLEDLSIDQKRAVDTAWSQLETGK